MKKLLILTLLIILISCELDKGYIVEKNVTEKTIEIYQHTKSIYREESYQTLEYNYFLERYEVVIEHEEVFDHYEYAIIKDINNPDYIITIKNKDDENIIYINKYSEYLELKIGDFFKYNENRHSFSDDNNNHIIVMPYSTEPYRLQDYLNE